MAKYHVETFYGLVQGSEQWKSLRAGLPTASCASKLVTPGGKPSSQYAQYAAQLAAEMYLAEPLDDFGGNEHTRYGLETEPEARAYWRLRNQKNENGGNDQPSFVINHRLGAGCSPDLFDGERGLEIKCQTRKNHWISVALASVGKDQNKYLPQLYWSMMVCDIDSWDLLLYHKDRPHLVNVPRDDQWISSAEIALERLISLRDEMFDKILKQDEYE